jgi:RimJ/RimL family protein N-acetyltransferase
MAYDPEPISGYLNDLGQAIGAPITDWQTRARPVRTSLTGQYCTLVPLEPERHAEALYAAFATDPDGKNWTYLPVGPFADLADFNHWLMSACGTPDPLFYAIIDQRTRRAVGMAALMRIDPTVGVVEVGHIHFSPLLQRTPLATEAMFLLMQRVFDELGYRRYEWKCDNFNAPSKRAAQRLGFQFEGIFRQAIVYKGRTRDTAWFSVIDSDWPALQGAFQRWLQATNFDADGRQKQTLESYRK